MTDEIRMRVGDLIHKIGATLTDAALGGPRGLAHDVRTGRQELTADQAIKVMVLEEVLGDIIEHEDLQVARLWLIGANPLLGEGNAVTAIREGRYEAVRNAALSFIRGEPDV